MLISIKRVARLAAVAGVSAAVVVGVTTPASAAAVKNEAFGIRATGLIQAGPFAHAAAPAGPTKNALVSAYIPNLLGAEAVTTSASASKASASVAELAVTLSDVAALGASVVKSQCTSAGPKGSTTIVDGAIVLAGTGLPLGGVPLAILATSPAPNTVVLGIPGVASIILNRQTAGPGGSLTVDAIYIKLLNAQEVRISTSRCKGTGGGYPPPPPPPGYPTGPSVPGVPGVPGLSGLPSLPACPVTESRFSPKQPRPLWGMPGYRVSPIAFYAPVPQTRSSQIQLGNHIRSCHSA